MAKRVLIYTNHFFPENFKVNDIASMLTEENIDVTVITGIPNYPEGKIPLGYGFFKRRKEFVNGVLVKRLWLIPRGSGSKLRMVLNYISYFLSCLLYTVYIAIFKPKYQTVFVHHTSPIFIAVSPIIYKMFRNPKMILWDLDMWPDTLVAMDIITSKKLTNLLEVMITWIYSKYDKILVGSKSFVEIAKKRVESNKIEYFPNWAEDIFINANLKAPENASYIPNGFKVMYTGNVGEAQDFENVFNAINLLKDKDINWLIVGGGRWLKQLKEMVYNSGLEDKVIYYGNNPIATMPYFFSKANVLFLSLQSKDIFSKTVPAKLQAYMASGKPVIGMISGEGNKIIKEASCGLSVPSGDYKNFAKAILHLMCANESLDELGENGRSYYLKHFSKEKRKKQLLKLL